MPNKRTADFGQQKIFFLAGGGGGGKNMPKPKRPTSAQPKPLPQRAPRRLRIPALFLTPLLLLAAAALGWALRRLPPSSPLAPPGPAVPPPPPPLRGARLPSMFKDGGNGFDPSRIGTRGLEPVDEAANKAGMMAACAKKGMSRWRICQDLGFKYIVGDEA